MQIPKSVTLDFSNLFQTHTWSRRPCILVPTNNQPRRCQILHDRRRGSSPPSLSNKGRARGSLSMPPELPWTQWYTPGSRCAAAEVFPSPFFLIRCSGSTGCNLAAISSEVCSESARDFWQAVSLIFSSLFTRLKFFSSSFCYVKCWVIVRCI